MENMANNWSPETGFHSEELKNHRDGYPKPGLGIAITYQYPIKKCYTLFFLSRSRVRKSFGPFVGLECIHK